MSSRSPVDGTPNVSRVPVIYVGFNSAALAGTVNSSTFTLSTGGSPVTANVLYNSCNNTASLEPTAPLNASTSYTVNLTSGITDTGGAPLAPDTFSFTTGPSADTTRPTFGGVTSAMATGTASVNLSWTAATDDLDAQAALVYDVFRSQTSGCYTFGAPLLTTAPAATSQSITGLASNTTHFFVVRARDTAGNASQTTTEMSATTLVSFTQDVWTSIISVRCAGCHPGGGAPFSMADPLTTYANWVNVDAVCLGLPPGTKRVVPSNSAASFLYNKISQAVPLCGSRMPLGRTPLPLTEQQTIQNWIDQGALNN